MLINICDENKKDILIKIINKVIDANQWSNKEAAHMLHTAIADISRIRRSKAANFSLARLLTFLVRLDYKVTIVIKNKVSIEQDISFECVISEC